MILWGPPGVGKTTLARLLADAAGARFETLSAVMSGVADVRALIAAAGGTVGEWRPADRPVRGRDPPLQQGPAGCPPAPRRGRHGHAHRGDHREPLPRGHSALLSRHASHAPGVADGRPRGDDRQAGDLGRRTRPGWSAGPAGGVSVADEPFGHLVGVGGETPARPQRAGGRRRPRRGRAVPTRPAGSPRELAESRPPPSSGCSPTTAPATATTTRPRRSSRASAANPMRPCTGWRRWWPPARTPGSSPAG